MLSKAQLGICLMGVCALTAGLILMWMLRPAAQLVSPFGQWLALFLFPGGIILILYGTQRAQRRMICLARAIGIYLLLGVIFWAVLICYFTVRAGTSTALFKMIEGLARAPWLFAYGVVFWPTMTIQVLGIFGYWLFD